METTVNQRETLKEFDKPKTYYDILGIKPDSGPREIRNAYLELAKRYHPDHTHNSNDRRMIELNLIYDILSHPDRKREYDERFAQSTLYDFSKNQESPPVKQKAEPKAKSAVIKELTYLGLIRIGLTALLFGILTYLTFYLVVKILQFFIYIPRWITRFIPG